MKNCAGLAVALPQEDFIMGTNDIGPQPRRRWSAESVLDEIRGLDNISPKFNQRIRSNLYGAAVRYFGSWKAAVEAAGIVYAMSSNRKAPGYWNRERVVAEIRLLVQRHSGYVRKHNRGLYSAALRLFSGWEEAIQAAGLDYSTIRRGWVAVDMQNLRFRKK